MAAHNFDPNMQQQQAVPNPSANGTIMWEGMWPNDSGVQSGASTHGEPSVRSGRLRPDEANWQQAGFPQQNPGYGQVDPNLEQKLLQTRDERIREAMFGEDPNRIGQPSKST